MALAFKGDDATVSLTKGQENLPAKTYTIQGYLISRLNTVEQFLPSNFLWPHTPLFGHILLYIQWLH